jgi:hypothetical protein
MVSAVRVVRTDTTKALGELSRSGKKTCRWMSSRTSVYFALRTNPTISIGVEFSDWCRTRCGVRLTGVTKAYRRAKRLTIATR